MQDTFARATHSAGRPSAARDERVSCIQIANRPCSTLGKIETKITNTVMQRLYAASTWIIIINHIALGWTMIDHSTLDYHLTNFNTLFRGSDGKMKTLNLYAGLNKNHNHDLNLFTIHLIVASVLGLVAIKVILHAKN